MSESRGRIEGLYDAVGWQMGPNEAASLLSDSSHHAFRYPQLGMVSRQFGFTQSQYVPQIIPRDVLKPYTSVLKPRSVPDGPAPPR